MMKNPLALTAAGLMIGALALTGCSSTKTISTPDNPYALADKTKLIVCADVPYAPFEFQDSNRDIVGYDMDLADRIARALGVTKEVKVMPFEQIQSSSALQSKDCDVAISSISINPQRQTKMAFSRPYYSDNLGLMTPESSSITNLADAKKSTVGVVAGTTGEVYAKEKGVKPTFFKDTGLLIQGLQSGQVESAIGNKSVLGYAAGTDSNLHFVEDYATGEKLGVAVKKDNTRLRDKVSAVIDDYEKSGDLAASQKRWFGVVTPEPGGSPSKGSQPSSGAPSAP